MFKRVFMRYLVPSFTGGNDYIVDLQASTCTCPHFRKIKSECKHLKHVMELKKQSKLFTLKLASTPSQGSLLPGELPTGEEACKELQYKFDKLAMVRLSPHFIMRDFLLSTYSLSRGIINYPSDDVDQVIASGKALCSKVLEPLIARFGPLSITFGYQNRKGTDLRKSSHGNTSEPHQWDRGTYGKEIYARVDILPYAVESGAVSRYEYAEWIMYNLDVDLVMQFSKSNVYCITISPKPRRVWLEWVPKGKGDGNSNKKTYMGVDFWQYKFPKLEPNQRPKYYPSLSGGLMYFQ